MNGAPPLRVAPGALRKKTFRMLRKIGSQQKKMLALRVNLQYITIVGEPGVGIRPETVLKSEQNINGFTININL